MKVPVVLSYLFLILEVKFAAQMTDRSLVMSVEHPVCTGQLKENV